MQSTSIPPKPPETADRVNAAADVEALVDELFAERNVLSRRELAAGLGVSLDSIKAAIASGALAEMRVAPRCARYTPAQVRRWLASTG